MARFVLDASVVIKWYVVEDHTDAAVRLQGGDHELCCPDFLKLEVANVAWKKVRRGEIDYALGQDIVRSVRGLPLHVTPFEDVIATAWEIAVHFGRSVYDGLYLALAITLEAPLVTADRKLWNALAGTPLAPHVRWIEDAAV